MAQNDITSVQKVCSCSEENIYTYEAIQEIVEFLFQKSSVRPRLGIILGTGLGPLAESVTEKVTVPYETIPNFPVSTTPGHEGELIFGKLESVPVVCMKGRFHFFEGYPAWKCAMPVRVMKLMGVTHLIISNAAGGLRDDLKVGDIMIIKDHINMPGFIGHSPLRGPNDERFGVRFPPMNRAYNIGLIDAAKQIAKELKLEHKVKEGVYTCLGGPHFETVSEVKLLKAFGTDAIGMSTVHEVTVAQHCGITVFAFSLITNPCVCDYESLYQVDHNVNVSNAKEHEESVKMFTYAMVRHIGKLI